MDTKRTKETLIGLAGLLTTLSDELDKIGAANGDGDHSLKGPVLHYVSNACALLIDKKEVEYGQYI